MSSIAIQQTAEQARLAFELHTHAEIESVRLQKARLVSRARLEALSGPIALRLSQKARKVEAPPGLLRLEIDFRVEGKREAPASKQEQGKNKQPFLLVECTWEADYRLAEGYQPAPEVVRAFKDGNAIFNCWPYFREFVQNAVTRMNLPPLTVPLLRLLPKPPGKKTVKSQRQLGQEAPDSRGAVGCRPPDRSVEPR